MTFLQGKVTARRWKPLVASERRYREAAKVVDNKTIRRCARQLSSGERFYETPVEKNADGSLRCPILHVAVDQAHCLLGCVPQGAQ